MTSRTTLPNCRKGCIVLETDKVRPGILRFGLTSINYIFRKPTVVSIRGKLVLRGAGYHTFGEGGHMIIRESGVLMVGNKFSIGRDWVIMVGAKSTIGDDNLLSWNMSLFDTDGHRIFDDENNIINPPLPFHIGNNVWIGAGSRILKGATIADGCIVSTGSIITKHLNNERSIYVENRCLKSNIHWTKENY